MFRKWCFFAALGLLWSCNAPDPQKPEQLVQKVVQSNEFERLAAVRFGQVNRNLEDKRSSNAEFMASLEGTSAEDRNKALEDRRSAFEAQIQADQKQFEVYKKRVQEFRTANDHLSSEAYQQGIQQIEKELGLSEETRQRLQFGREMSKAQFELMKAFPELANHPDREQLLMECFDFYRKENALNQRYN
jgi:hypothetical protein